MQNMIHMSVEYDQEGRTKYTEFTEIIILTKNPSGLLSHIPFLGAESSKFSESSFNMNSFLTLLDTFTGNDMTESATVTSLLRCCNCFNTSSPSSISRAFSRSHQTRAHQTDCFFANLVELRLQPFLAQSTTAELLRLKTTAESAKHITK
jgi:hypothetical protein